LFAYPGGMMMAFMSGSYEFTEIVGRDQSQKTKALKSLKRNTEFKEAKKNE